MKTYSKIMEFVWLLLAVGFTIAIIYMAIKGVGFEGRYLIFAMPVIASFQYYMRRRYRKGLEKNNFNDQKD